MELGSGRRFWIALTAVVSLFTAVTAGRNLWHIFKVKREIAALQDEARNYRESIARDSTLIERLRYDDYLEEYARERYRMQREGEKIYILE